MKAIRPVVIVALDENIQNRDDDENSDDGADGFGVHIVNRIRVLILEM